MTSPVPTGPATMATNPLDDPASVAHGWLHKLQVLVGEAKAELSRFLPADAVDQIENRAEQDVEGGIRITEDGADAARIRSSRVDDVADPDHPAQTTGEGIEPLPGDNDRAARPEVTDEDDEAADAAAKK